MVKQIDPKRLAQIVKECEELKKHFLAEEVPEPVKTMEWYSKRRLPRILVLYTGGTLGMAKKVNPRTGKEALSPTLSLEQLMRKAHLITGVKNDFEIVGYHISHIDSTEINIKIWNQMATILESEYDNFDGAVVLHGTDTMAYSAAAMAFTLRNLAKPIVFTGAQKILKKSGTDVIANLTGALEVAASDLAEVALFFNGDIFRGTKVDKRHDTQIDAFHAPNFRRIGTLENDVVLSPDAVLRGKYAPSKLTYNPGFASSVVEVVLSPVSAPGEIANAVQSTGCQGLMIRSYGPGNIPRWYNPVIEYLTKEVGFPVFISSQCAGSGISGESEYEPGKEAIAAGALPIGDMSPPSAAVKLMKVMHRTQNLPEIQHEMVRRSYAGEITVK